jgi:hypothetical protein
MARVPVFDPDARPVGSTEMERTAGREPLAGLTRSQPLLLETVKNETDPPQPREIA